jgi:hypothetical protein
LYKAQIHGETSATLKMEEESSSEMLVLKLQITRRHKPEDCNSVSRLRQNLKIHKENYVFKSIYYLIFYPLNTISST